MGNVVLVFASNAGAMVATKALRESGVPARMMPTPATVAGGSNLCLSIDPAVEDRAFSALQAAKVSIATVQR